MFLIPWYIGWVGANAVLDGDYDIMAQIQQDIVDVQEYTPDPLAALQTARAALVVGALAYVTWRVVK